MVRMLYYEVWPKADRRGHRIAINFRGRESFALFRRLLAPGTGYLAGPAQLGSPIKMRILGAFGLLPLGSLGLNGLVNVSVMLRYVWADIISNLGALGALEMPVQGAFSHQNALMGHSCLLPHPPRPRIASEWCRFSSPMLGPIPCEVWRPGGEGKCLYLALFWEIPLDPLLHPPGIAPSISPFPQTM